MLKTFVWAVCLGLRLHPNEQSISYHQLLGEVDPKPVGRSRCGLLDILLARYRVTGALRFERQDDKEHFRFHRSGCQEGRERASPLGTGVEPGSQRPSVLLDAQISLVADQDP